MELSSIRKAHRIGGFLSPLAFSFATLLIALALFGIACTSQNDVPPLEQRAHQLDQTIMCPVCPGESIDQSGNPLAVQMRGIVTDKLQEGWSDGQIRQFFVDRYGPSVLLEPPREGFNILAWLVPPIAFLGALSSLVLVIRLMRRIPASRSNPLPQGNQAGESDASDYYQRVEAAMERSAGPPKSDDGDKRASLV